MAATTIGPEYLLNPNGTSALGDTNGLPNVFGYQAGASTPILDWTIPALGAGPAVGPLGPATSTPTVVAAAGSLGRILDEASPGLQTPNTNQVTAWSPSKGAIAAGWPGTMNDLQFFDQPIIANVAGTSAGGYAVETSGLYDLRAYGPGGTEAPGFPKFTGGWVTFGPAYGPWGHLSDQVLAAGNRNGELFVWTTPTAACASSGPWPQLHHDLWNTGNLSETETPTPACTSSG
jgi:hypothetical protein